MKEIRNVFSVPPSLSSLCALIHFEIILDLYTLELGKCMGFISNKTLGFFFPLLIFHRFMDP